MTIAELLDHPDPFGLPPGELLAPFLPVRVERPERRRAYGYTCRRCGHAVKGTQAQVRTARVEHRRVHAMTDADALPRR